MANPKRVTHPEAEAKGLTVADSITIAARIHKDTARALSQRSKEERILRSDLIRRAIDAELSRPQALVASLPPEESPT